MEEQTVSYFTDQNDRKWWDDDFEIEPADDHTWRRFLLIAAFVLMAGGAWQHFKPKPPEAVHISKWNDCRIYKVTPTAAIYACGGLAPKIEIEVPNEWK